MKTKKVLVSDLISKDKQEKYKLAPATYSNFNIGDKFRFYGSMWTIKDITDAEKEKSVYNGCSFLHLEKI